MTFSSPPAIRQKTRRGWWAASVPPALALRSDVVLLGAVAAVGGSADVSELAAALRAAEYSASTSTQLARTCPVLVRVGRGHYAPR